MVVKKKSAAPVAASRTNSVQALPQARKTTVKSIPSTKTSKKKKKQSSGFLDSFVVLLLSFFALYTATTCPKDENLINPVCRGLERYKTYVLDPLLDQLDPLINHPSLQPIHDTYHRVSPYVDQAIQRVEPVVQYVEQQAQRTWSRAIVPRYYAHLHPHLKPYLYKLDSQVLTPYFYPAISEGIVRLHQLSSHVHHTYVSLQPHFRSAQRYTYTLYVNSKPYVIHAWEVTRPLLIKAGEKFGEYRRIYVDPHVWRIMEKVKELSGTTVSQEIKTNTSVTAASTIEETPKSATSTKDIPLSTSSVVVESTTPEVPEEPIVPTASTTTQESDTTSETASAEAEFESASSVVAASAHQETSLIEEISASSSSIATASSTPSSFTEAELESASSVVAASAHQETSVLEEISASQSSIASSSAPSSTTEASPIETAADPAPPSPPEVDDDLKDFLDSIGYTDEPEMPPPPVAEEVPSQPPPPPETETPEEKAAQVAAKRADIEGRHTIWERKIREKKQERMEDAKDFIVAIREIGGAVVLGKDHSSSDLADLELYIDTKTLTHIDGIPVGTLLNGLDKDAEKLLGGLEGWVRREEKSFEGLKSETSKQTQERLDKWQKVLERVQEKFEEKVVEMRGRVHRWYRAVRNLEVDECLLASSEVKAIADQGQTDIGLDYAWLEDVTYQDWQRYHDLMRAYESFDAQIRTIQESLPDALVPALDVLDGEVNDLSGGWEQSVRALAARVRAIGQKEETASSQASSTSSPTPKEEEVPVLGLGVAPPATVKEEEKAVQVESEKSVQLEGEKGVEVTPDESEKVPAPPVEHESQVSIPPVPPVTEKEGVLEGEANPFIGKSKEQVEEAMKMYEERVREHEEL